MSRYGNAVYGASKYGEAPKLAYSVEPMKITVIDFDKIHLEWQQPTGTFTKFRIVRNTSGFSETSEDGEIVFEQSSVGGDNLQGNLTTLSLFDGVDNLSAVKIVPGTNLYYTVFLFTSDKVWVKAGKITDVVPKDTGAYTRMMNLIPRVFTSKELSPLGTIDESSDLAKFMSALSFSYEQWQTSINLLKPGTDFEKSVYSTIPGEALSIGLDVEPNLPVENQRRLIRQGIYLQANRGTKVGLEDYAESLTGYTPSATVSSNLMLSVQDSTFYQGIGNWAWNVGSNVSSFVASTEQIAAPATLQIDTSYSGKLTLSNSGYIVLGEGLPITQGVPVLELTDYVISCKVKSPASAGNATLNVKFYDKDGTQLSSHNSTTVAANNTWKSISLTTTSDEGACYASLRLTCSAAGTYYFDQVCFQKGTTVSYEEARCITLNLISPKTNYIYNPSFEVDAATWALSGTSFARNSDTSFDAYSSNYSGAFTSTGTWSITTDYNLPVTPGFYYTVSAYEKSADIANVTMTINLYDSSDTVVETYTETDPISSTWSRLYTKFLVASDSTATYAKVTFGSTDYGTLLLDMVQFERTSSPTEYFDGSLPVDYGAIWGGTANASVSYLYPSKQIKIPRLANTLNDWVPLNSFWRITTPAGLEYNNLNV